MRAVLVGNDYLKDNNGNFKYLESNTSVLPSFTRAEDYFNKGEFDQFLLDNNITEITIIDPIGPNFLKDGFDKQHDGTSAYQKISHMFTHIYGETHSVNFITQNKDGSIPLIEDADNKLILRIAYDNNALVDETYCRDNFEFLKLISDSNPNSLPNIFFNDGEGVSVDTIGTTIPDNGNHPNFIIKERYPTTNYINYPKVYKITTEGELNTIKNGLTNNETLQEYICNTNDLLDGKLKTYRHLTILYGSDLSMLNVFDTFVHTNRLPLSNDVDYDDTTNELSIWERPKYLQKTGRETTGVIYTGSENDRIQKSDGSLTQLKDVRILDSLSTVELAGLGLGENDHVHFESNIKDLNSGNVYYSPTFDSVSGGMVYDDKSYLNPTGSEGSGGFTNTNTELSNIEFNEGGRITFDGSCNGSVDIQIILGEDYSTEPITISGEQTKYSVEVPVISGTCNSFILKVVTQDTSVSISRPKIIAYKGGLNNTSSTVEDIISSLGSFFEYYVTLSGGKTYTFLGASQVLSSGPEEDMYRFMSANSLVVGCKIITKDLSGGNLIPETIVSMSFKYVHEVAYSMDVEDIDYYIRTNNSETPTQGVIHHNNKGVGCLCYYKAAEWESCFCNTPCIYAMGECDQTRSFIDCCSSEPKCGSGTKTMGLCGEGGGKE